MEEASGSAQDDLGVRDRRLRVLHIEDDPALAEMYAIGLEMQGFEVLRAADGLAGIQTAQTNDIDFLVVDIGLPGMDGLGVLARLREDSRTSALPALLLTAFNPVDYGERAAVVGVEQVLLKSETSPRGLAEAIRSLLTRTDRSNLG